MNSACEPSPVWGLRKELESFKVRHIICFLGRFAALQWMAPRAGK